MHRAQVRMNLNRSEEGAPVTHAPSGRTFSKTVPAPPSPSVAHKHPKVMSEQEQSQPRPPQFARKLKNAAIGTGCDIRLKVAVSGNPVPTLSWYKNQEPVHPGAEEYGTLCIRDSRMEDAGVYTCVAQNASGEAITSAVLAIIDLEGDPIFTNRGTVTLPTSSVALETLRGAGNNVSLGDPGAL